MSRMVTISSPKMCDICHYVECRTSPNVARWDCKTVTGQWANICETHAHHALYREPDGTPSLGTGKGQELVVK